MHAVTVAKQSSKVFTKFFAVVLLAILVTVIAYFVILYLRDAQNDDDDYMLTEDGRMQRDTDEASMASVGIVSLLFLLICAWLILSAPDNTLKNTDNVRRENSDDECKEMPLGGEHEDPPVETNVDANVQKVEKVEKTNEEHGNRVTSNAVPVNDPLNPLQTRFNNLVTEIKAIVHSNDSLIERCKRIRGTNSYGLVYYRHFSRHEHYYIYPGRTPTASIVKTFWIDDSYEWPKHDIYDNEKIWFRMPLRRSCAQVTDVNVKALETVLSSVQRELNPAEISQQPDDLASRMVESFIAGILKTRRVDCKELFALVKTLVRLTPNLLNKFSVDSYQLAPQYPISQFVVDSCPFYNNKEGLFMGRAKDASATYTISLDSILKLFKGEINLLQFGLKAMPMFGSGLLSSLCSNDYVNVVSRRLVTLFLPPGSSTPDMAQKRPVLPDLRIARLSFHSDGKISDDVFRDMFDKNGLLFDFCYPPGRYGANVKLSIPAGVKEGGVSCINGLRITDGTELWCPETTMDISLFKTLHLQCGMENVTFSWSGNELVENGDFIERLTIKINKITFGDVNTRTMTRWDSADAFVEFIKTAIREDLPHWLRIDQPKQPGLIVQIVLQDLSPKAGNTFSVELGSTSAMVRRVVRGGLSLPADFTLTTTSVELKDFLNDHAKRDICRFLKKASLTAGFDVSWTTVISPQMIVSLMCG